MTRALPAAWRQYLAEETTQPYYQELQDFIAAERATHEVFPPEPEVFAALEHTPYDEVKVVILGQDPYPTPGHAHGLAFSVRPGVKPLPGSLRNIFKEMHDDLGVPVPQTGYLMPWAEQGVLLLNAVLTVRGHKPNSHKGKGWEIFTDAALSKVNEKTEPVVFVLWGNYARKKVKLIDSQRHVILEAAHPSPLSARSGFFGSRPFSKINAALLAARKAPILWQL